MDNTKNLRNIVLSMLVDTLEKGELSHLVLKRTFETEKPDARERAFLNRCYSGTLEKLIYLDYVLNAFSSVPVRKMKPVIRNLLRLSSYQLLFMESVPAHACINEAVSLTGKRGFSGLKGFVNAVLRKVDQKAAELSLPDHVKACAPQWLYEMIIAQYGTEDAERYFQAIQETDDFITVRLNLQKASKEEILARLRSEGCEAVPLTDTEDAWALSGFENLISLKSFREGLIIMQDRASMKAVQIAAEGMIRSERTADRTAGDMDFLCVKEQGLELFVDVCAAPGGKSLYLAEKFPAARILSRDLTEKKVDLIRENQKRLSVMNLEPQIWDALVQDPTLTGQADLVMADLPCSGLGVVRRKPDILYRLKQEDLNALQDLQRKILSVVQSYVKPGGVLLYSTCTVNRGENEENTLWFRQNFPFVLEREEQFIPGKDDWDGFYIARLRKKAL